MITIVSILCGVVVYFGVFEIPDNFLIDAANRYLEIEKEKDVPISIIVIDDKTESEYGAYETWSRQISADLVNKLNEQNNKPVIIGMDLPYAEKKDELGDASFVSACAEGGNVCIGIRQDENRRKEILYEELLDVVQVGISNNFLDGSAHMVREFVTTFEDEEDMLDGFAVVLYKKYQEHAGKEYDIDFENVRNMQFNYARNSQEYEVYSFIDVMNGTVDVTNFQNKIVIVGDHTKQATIIAPFSMGNKMQDVLLQAHMVDAMLSQRVIQQLPKLIVACLP